jgi:hypothetical protein
VDPVVDAAAVGGYLFIDCVRPQNRLQDNLSISYLVLNLLVFAPVLELVLGLALLATVAFALDAVVERGDAVDVAYPLRLDGPFALGVPDQPCPGGTVVVVVVAAAAVLAAFRSISAAANAVVAPRRVVVLQPAVEVVAVGLVAEQSAAAELAAAVKIAVDAVGIAVEGSLAGDDAVAEDVAAYVAAAAAAGLAPARSSYCIC